MTNYFDKLKSKVNSSRRSSESVLIDLKVSQVSKSRSQSIAIPDPQTSRSRSNSQTKLLIKQQKNYIVSKKLGKILQDLGLQQPIPLKTTTNGNTSKSVKIFVANTNDVIFVAPASSASFTYEDVDGGVYEPVEEVAHDELSDNPSFERRNSNTSENSSSSIPSIDEDHELQDNSFNYSEIPNYPNYLSSTPFNNNNNNHNNHNQTSGTRSATANHLHHHQRQNELNKKIGKFHSPNYLCTKIDADSPIPHTFAVVVELAKDMVVRDVAIEFQSINSVLWPTGDPYNKSHHKEKFKIGNLQWSTNLADADYFISLTNSNDVKFADPPITTEVLAQRTRNYTLININHLMNDGVINSFNEDCQASDEFISLSKTNSSREMLHKAGIYVFLLPMLLPEHIPATISSINGSLIHNLSVTLNKLSDKLNRKIKIFANYNLPIVRTPPSFANSIADKPIYVNRVWNDSLHYFITFPKKYINLGSEHVINIKLIPLVKDVIIKRIKFNVLEKITYVSRDLTREYDYDSEDPYMLKHTSSKSRERIVSLCELKTKLKSTSNQSEPFKEEIIKCPENNLLYSCYEPEKDSKDMISTPLDINIALPFLTTKSDKTILTSNTVEEQDCPTRKASIVESNPNSSIIGNLETNLHNLHENNTPSRSFAPNLSSFNCEDHLSHKPSALMQKGISSITRALYPDSNYRHIQVNHRLQVCFRISKPDPKDNFKMHHYEVVVDTPLILLSSKCDRESLQLPKYDEIIEEFPIESPTVSFRTPIFERNGITIKSLVDDSEPLPTFEEATGEPLERTVSVADDPLDTSNPIISPPDYEVSDSKDNRSLPSIDNIFDPNVASNQNQTKVRSSLSQSFSATRRTRDHSEEIDPIEQINRAGTMTSSDSNSNSDRSIHSKIETSISSTSELNAEELVVISNDKHEEPQNVEPEETIELEDRRNNVSSMDNASLITQDTNAAPFYEQRLPLLQHYSSEAVSKLNKGVTTMSIQSDNSNSQAMTPNKPNQLL